MLNKQNKLIKELISKLDKDGVDVSKYTQELDDINKNLKDKKYGLVWEQHTEPLIEELKSKMVELHEDKNKRIYNGNNYTNNFLIEGDNLESLNAMLKSGLEGKIDLIYIDVPYNTGSKDFKYVDKFVDKEDSYRHSKWLSFMDIRLKKSIKLLNEQGFIFISVDENEVYNLKLLCDEIYGERNFIANISVENNPKGRKNSNYISYTHEYLLIYRKTNNNLKFNLTIPKQDFRKVYKDNKGSYKQGKRILIGTDTNKEILNVNSDKNYDVAYNGNNLIILNRNLDGSYINDDINLEGYHIYKNINKYSNKINEATYSKNYFLNLYVNNNLIFKDNVIYDKDRELKSRFKSIMNKDNLKGIDILTETSGKDLKDMLGDDTFIFPKNINFIKEILKLHPNKNATILDFFAGSGTTGHACLELNKEDGGSRQFILCTNNENNICEDITYQRLNKVINGYTTPKGKEIEGIPANLTYLKTELVDKEDSDFIFYDKSHLEYLKNLLKLKYSISEDVDIEIDSEALLTILKGKDKEIYIYLNDYVDLEDFKAIELDEEKENLIYVDNSLVNDLNLTKKGFKEINKVNHYFN